MSNETITTLIGNLAEAPELRVTSGGVSVARFRIGCTPRKQKDGKYVDGETSWYTVNVWRDLAEHCADSLRKGDQVVVYGALSVRQYETADGKKGTSTEVEAYAVGVSLQFGTAQLVKAVKGGGRPAQSADSDPWGGAQPAQARQQAAADPSTGW